MSNIPYTNISETPENESIQNIEHSINSMINTECYDKNGLRKKHPTCIINDKMIKNISYFLSHKIPKCKELNITLDNIKNGKIISKDEYLYSFMLTNKLKKKITISIIVDNGNKKENKYSEINLYSRISLSENNNFIKLYGYIVNDEIKSFLKTHIMYAYFDVNHKLLCKFPSKRFSESSEIYLLTEGCEMDMFTYMKNLDENNISELTEMFFDLLNFYKISEYFLDKEDKIFIHSDIKLEHMFIVIDTDNKKKIKLRPSSLSILADSFNKPIDFPTLYHNYYFYYNGKIYNNLMHRSPLFDIYSVIISYIRILLYITIKKNIDSELYDFDQLITLIETNEDKIKINELSKNTKEKIFRIFKLGLTINEFNKARIKKFVTELSYIDSFSGDRIYPDDKARENYYKSDMLNQIHELHINYNDRMSKLKYLQFEDMYKYNGPVVNKGRPKKFEGMMESKIYKAMEIFKKFDDLKQEVGHILFDPIKEREIKKEIKKLPNTTK